MAEVPFYLRPNDQVNQIDWLNLGPIPSGASTSSQSSPTSIWGTLGDVAESTWDMTKNAGSHVAESVSSGIKSTVKAVSSVGSSVTSGIGSIADEVGDRAEGFAWSIVRIFMVVAGVLFVGLYFLGKSGAIGQAAGFVKPF